MTAPVRSAAQRTRTRMPVADGAGAGGVGGVEQGGVGASRRTGAQADGRRGGLPWAGAWFRDRW
ncbi:hypothetical protein Shyhy01_37230 [Streptomyces hygroscopicus subsp. hygroscopicus]|nr:hypothetical protein Shyhy01_37230 [Streptomyces hygroscopicus subsp. hygroscopicus]